MKSTLTLAGCAAAVAFAQGPSSSFQRGSGQQAWQNAGYKAALATCKNPPTPFAIPGAGQSATANAAPPEPVLPAHRDSDDRAGLYGAGEIVITTFRC